jgi:hypothetical protein
MATSSTSSSPPGGGAEDLVIPNNFFQREGHVLLRFVLDDLGDLAGVDRRQLDELGERRGKPGAQTLTFCLAAGGGDDLLQSLLDGCFARGLLRAFRPEGLMA